MDDLTHDPHHDGSPLYLSQESAPLGGRVRVRVRTSAHDPVDAVWLRTVEDAEPFFTACSVETTEDATTWWTGEVRVRNPVQRYRFMVVTGDGFRWLNQAGVHDRDVTDAHDFRVTAYDGPPDWGRDAVVYQVFPDRFARSAAADDRPTPSWAVPARWTDPPVHQGPETPLQLYGGDLDGIVEHLDHLVSLGVDTVYLTPVFPGESNHRYNASTFDAVDPLLGGDEAYRRLVDAAHERGLRVLGDLTSNHTGDTHEWFLRATADPGSAERGFYYFDAAGNHEGWKGHDTLPKLDHLDEEVRRRMRGVVVRWLEFGLDGWRIDVANMTGRHAEVDVAHEVARDLRAAATRVRPDALVLAEHGHDATGDLDGDGWHGTMNYYGFSFPVWEWLRDPDRPVPSFGLPVGVPRRDGVAMVGAMRDFAASFGWRAVTTSWNILGSHDSPRIRTTTGSAALHHVAAVLQFTLPGVPMVFAGDELGLEGTNGEDSRRTMPWQDRERWDTTTLQVYADLARLRREHIALRRGGLRWVRVGADDVGFLREHPDETLLVTVARTGDATLPTPGPEVDEVLTVGSPEGPHARVWRTS
ncbi:MAG TPA: glycoside hydrolase family 13 protein [Marmoricola sp.]